MFRIDSAKIEAGGCNTKGNSIPIDDMYIGYVKKKRFESSIIYQVIEGSCKLLVGDRKAAE